MRRFPLLPILFIFFVQVIWSYACIMDVGDIYKYEHREHDWKVNFSRRYYSLTWSNKLDLSTYNDYASATCCDNNYCYIVGHTYDEGDGDGAGSSMFVLKIDKGNGTVIDSLKFEPLDGTANDDTDTLYDCVIVNDSLYATGFSWSGGEARGYIVKIFLSNFTIASEYDLNYIVNNTDALYSIDTDGSYLYVSGYYVNSTESERYVLVRKIDLNGNPIINYTVSGDDVFGCRASSVASDGVDISYTIRVFQGNVYVGMQYACLGDWGGDGQNDDNDFRIGVIKLNASDLNLQTYYVKDWVVQTWEGSYQHETTNSLDVDSRGVYISGIIWIESSGKQKGYVLLLDPNSLQEEISFSWLTNNASVAVPKVKITGDSVTLFGSESDGTYYHQKMWIFTRGLSLVENVTLDSGAYNSYFTIGKVAYEPPIIYVAGYDYAPRNYEVNFYRLEIYTGALSDVAKVTIQNPNNYDLTDYQVRVNLTGVMDYNNIKVCSDDICTQTLNFCYEQANGECDIFPTPVIWVKVPNIPANGETIIYIFNDTVNNAVNGSEVFDFYDDFNDGILNFDQYPYSVSTTSLGTLVGYDSSGWSEVNGTVVHNITQDLSHMLAIKNITIGSAVYLARINLGTLEEIEEAGIVFSANLSDPIANRYFARYLYRPSLGIQEFQLIKMTNGTPTQLSSYAYTLSNDQWIWLKVEHNVDTGLIRAYFSVDGKTWTLWANITDTDHSGGVFGLHSAYNLGVTHSYDYLIVKKYADQEPTVTVQIQNLSFIINNRSIEFGTNIVPNVINGSFSCSLRVPRSCSFIQLESDSGIVYSAVNYTANNEILFDLSNPQYLDIICDDLYLKTTFLGYWYNINLLEVAKKIPLESDLTTNVRFECSNCAVYKQLGSYEYYLNNSATIYITAEKNHTYTSSSPPIYKTININFNDLTQLKPYYHIFLKDEKDITQPWNVSAYSTVLEFTCSYGADIVNASQEGWSDKWYAFKERPSFIQARVTEDYSRFMVPLSNFENITFYLAPFADVLKVSVTVQNYKSGDLLQMYRIEGTDKVIVDRRPIQGTMDVYLLQQRNYYLDILRDGNIIYSSGPYYITTWGQTINIIIMSTLKIFNITEAFPYIKVVNETNDTIELEIGIVAPEVHSYLIKIYHKNGTLLTQYGIANVKNYTTYFTANKSWSAIEVEWYIDNALFERRIFGWPTAPTEKFPISDQAWNIWVFMGIFTAGMIGSIISIGWSWAFTGGMLLLLNNIKAFNPMIIGFAWFALLFGIIYEIAISKKIWGWR